MLLLFVAVIFTRSNPPSWISSFSTIAVFTILPAAVLSIFTVTVNCFVFVPTGTFTLFHITVPVVLL